MLSQYAILLFLIQKLVPEKETGFGWMYSLSAFHCSIFSQYIFYVVKKVNDIYCRISSKKWQKTPPKNNNNKK